MNKYKYNFIIDWYFCVEILYSGDFYIYDNLTFIL